MLLPTTLCPGIYEGNGSKSYGKKHLEFALTDCKIITIPGGVFMDLVERNHKFCITVLESFPQICGRRTREFLTFFSGC